ncbi:MAG: hypothetical protein PUP93_26570 [Rhizonema sp. NSF051]|nr:hypothetical protein [Rhizonema sp. NSF051]
MEVDYRIVWIGVGIAIANWTYVGLATATFLVVVNPVVGAAAICLTAITALIFLSGRR